MTVLDLWCIRKLIHQDSMYRHRNGDRRQWNRIWNPEIYPQTYGE